MYTSTPSVDVNASDDAEEVGDADQSDDDESCEEINLSDDGEWCKDVDPFNDDEYCEDVNRSTAMNSETTTIRPMPMTSGEDVNSFDVSLPHAASSTGLPHPLLRLHIVICLMYLLN
ncbi:hypothetical protein BGY98DRAFT_1102310 [Russula aff. rugulosa BPL654]|nr:hypothetical protein BGY98DRAFT_1102310 [Russula aff. rugulosa BPL654]